MKVLNEGCGRGVLPIEDTIEKLARHGRIISSTPTFEVKDTKHRRNLDIEIICGLWDKTSCHAEVSTDKTTPPPTLRNGGVKRRSQVVLPKNRDYRN